MEKHFKVCKFGSWRWDFKHKVYGFQSQKSWNNQTSRSIYVVNCGKLMFYVWMWYTYDLIKLAINETFDQLIMINLY